MSVMTMEHRINLLSKTSPIALSVLTGSCRLPRVSSEGSTYEPISLSCAPLPTPIYRCRRLPRSVSTPPDARQCTGAKPTRKSSSSSGKPSDPKNSEVVDNDADYIQTVFPVGLIDNVPDMDLAMFTQIAEITDCLYLSAASAIRIDRLTPRMITLIINCTLDTPNFKAPNIECINIQVDDSRRAHLGIHFDRCADMIREVSHKGGKVLVHCVAGISRSASLCIAYLMKYERMPLNQAYRHVKRRRPVVHPNVGFWQQLIDYEKRVFGTNTVKMVHSNMGRIPDVYADEAKNFIPMTRQSRLR